MRRNSDDEISAPALLALFLIVFVGLCFYYNAVKNDCADKGGHLDMVHMKTWVCISNDGRILE